jgi:hypothetical protein
MGIAGASLRQTSTGGRRKGGAMLRRHGVAIAAAVATLAPLAACQTPGPADLEQARRVQAGIDAGLNLYEAGDYVLAARRFQEMAQVSRFHRDVPMERKIRTAECTAWLRARRLGDLSACSERLETLQRKGRRSDPALNTLLALGAVAGGRPLPPFRVPSAVHPIVRATAKE